MDNDSLQPWPIGKPPEPTLCGEDARASVLSAYGLDALEDDPELAQITQFVSHLCEAPIALVTLVEQERQRFLARAGLEERETPRPTSFCAHAMLEPEPMVVTDALQDPRFETNPLVTGQPYIRFYAGAPLISHEGAPLGSLCVIDVEPRPAGLTATQKQGLEVLAASVMRRLRHRRERLEQTDKLERSEKSLRTLINSLPDIAYSIRSDGTFDYLNRRFFENVSDDRPHDSEAWRPLIHPDDREQVMNSWYHAFEKGINFEARYRLKMRSGDWRWHLSRVLPLSDEDGKHRSWFGTMTDIQDTYRESEDRDLLARELSHRIKNIFAVIGGLIALKSRDYPGAKEFSEDVAATLYSLSRAHTYVTQERADTNETLHGLLGKLLAPYGDQSGSRMDLSGDDVPVSAKSATPLALVFHELATNSAKYGAFSVAGGKVAVVTRVQRNEVVLVWTETGGPEPEQDRGLGFGSRLVEKSVDTQLSGSLTRDFTPEGMIATLTLPLSAL